jgi:hypothetical protein
LSTTAEVRAAFSTKLWADATLKAVTPNLYDFDLEDIAGVSSVHAAKMYHNQKINFLAARFGRSVQWGQTRGAGAGAIATYTYPVFVKYYRDAKEDLTGTEYNATEDFINTLLTRMIATLGNTWNATVDYWLPQEGMAGITLGELDARPVWVASYSFTGFKEAVFS